MDNPNILFTRKDTAELVDRPVPEPSAGEVRVRLARSCISSGTERANLIGVPDRGVAIFATGDGVTWPRQSGYSSSGVVDKVGAGVTALKIGDRVAVSWSVHARFVCVPAERAYEIPDGVSFEHAALAHISTFPMAALRKCRLEFGESVLVMGQGVLGQIAVKLARAAGAAPIVVGDPVAAKREAALALGADFAFDPSAPDFGEQVKAVTDGGAKVVVEVTGVDKALDNALDATARFGRIALLGCTRQSNFTIDYYHKVHGRGITLVGAHTLARPERESSSGWWTTRDDARTFLRLLQYKRVSLDGFVEEVYSPDECGEVYARLATGGLFPTTQFDWERL